MPELKKVVVVPYVKSVGEEAAFGTIKNGFVCATLPLASYVTFLYYTIDLLTAVTCAEFKNHAALYINFISPNQAAQYEKKNYKITNKQSK